MCPSKPRLWGLGPSSTTYWLSDLGPTVLHFLTCKMELLLTGPPVQGYGEDQVNTTPALFRTALRITSTQ